MPNANIHDQRSLEKAYPPDAYAADAAENGGAAAELVKGVRIMSAPDAAGDFLFERAVRQVGETGSAAFLAPHRREDRLVDAGRDRPSTEGYEAFLADIIAAARQFGFDPAQSPGRDDPRLKGLRQ